MRAMILAAGRGERLKPLTDTMPKPLVEVGEQSLIERHINGLANAGFREIVINLSYLGEKIEEAIGNGSRFGVDVAYSWEPEGALETGGGIVHALDLLGNSPFAVINGDIYCDYPYQKLRAIKCDYAHLVLTANPEHNPSGDFSLEGGRIRNTGALMGTFSGIAVYNPGLFEGHETGRYSVVPILRNAIDNHLVTGEWHRGQWCDVGTVERLEKLASTVSS